MKAFPAITQRFSADWRAFAAGLGQSIVMLCLTSMLWLGASPDALAEVFPAEFFLGHLNGSNGFRLDGEAAGDRSGFSVSGIGDVNGDGIDDLIIGAHLADPNGNSTAGTSYVVFGRHGDFQSTLNLGALDGFNGFRLEGVAAGDHSGNSVSGAGDLNGDGIDDFVIGANLADPNGNSRAGSSYVIFGRSTGFPATLDLGSLNGVNGFRLDGEAGLDGSGGSVSAAGDIDGDGIADLVIGASGADFNGNGSGSSYLVFGASAFPAVMNLGDLNGSNGFRIDGAEEGDRAGNSVSAAGDVNADGIDDLIIGAFRANDDAGSAFVVFGRSAPFPATLSLGILDGTNGFRLNGVAVEDFAGRSVAGAGDVNGDGIDDVIVGADRADPGGMEDAGSAYVFFGRSTPFPAAIGLSSIDGLSGFRLDGRAAGDRAGYAVHGAGDVDRDGFDDVIVGSLENSTSYVVFGQGGGFTAAISLDELDGNTGFLLFNSSAGTHPVRSVSTAGDVNGDGIDDFVMGADTTTVEGVANVGSTYVMFGRDASTRPFPSVIELSSLDGRTGVEFNSLLELARTAHSVSSAGDFNGDGIGDLLIGQPKGFPDFSELGAVNLIFGSGATLANPFPLWELDSATGIRFVGEELDDRFGTSVASAGDINGDGRDDLVVGAPQWGSTVGSSYVVFGTDEGLGSSFLMDDLDGGNGFAIRGESDGSLSGYSVSRAGDINGDGLDDLLIGAPWSDNPDPAGRSYVVFGSDVPFAHPFELSSLDGSNGFALDGEVAGDWSGWSVSAAGDVNGDGMDDLVIGAFRGNPGGISRAGRSYVVFGSSKGFPHPFLLFSLDGSNGFVLNGEAEDDRSGHSVGAAGDVNGDGIDDLIVGALDADPNGNSSAGRSYVVFGRNTASEGPFQASFDLADLDGSNGFIIDGEGRIHRSGRAVGSAGDINGDGINDLIIGASGADPNGTQSGRSYVVYGSRSGLPSPLRLSNIDGTNGFVLNGEAPEEFSGYSVSHAGDINNDGLDDLVIGAPLANPLGFGQSGVAYLLFGRSNTIFADRFEKEFP